MMSWGRFLAAILGLTAGLTAALWAAVLAIDPFDIIPFSPDLERAAIDANQRFAYPALARDPQFDSLVIGTSVGRLLRPERLERRLGGRFVNLSMNAATPGEQSRMFELFRRHHPDFSTVVLEIDPMWCRRDRERVTKRHFPAWLYDDDPWNDLLPHLSFHGLEQAGRQLAYLLGLRPARFARDGYARYLPPPEAYDVELVRQKLSARRAREEAQSGHGDPLDPLERQALRFPDHRLMAEMLGALPDETLKIMMFAPMHRVVIPPAGTKGWSIITECKARLASLAAQVRNGHVLDFMIESRITRHDVNFWDAHHFKEELADRLIDMIAQGIAERRGLADQMDYLDLRSLN